MAANYSTIEQALEELRAAGPPGFESGQYEGLICV